MSRLRSKLKLFLAAAAAVLTAGVILFLYFYIGVRQRRITYEDSKWIAIEQSHDVASEIERYFIKAIMVARSLRDQSLVYFKSGADRSNIVELFKTTLLKNPDFLAIWTMWEPQYYKVKQFDEFSDSAGNFQISLFYHNGDLLTEKVNPSMYLEDYYLIPKETKQEMVIEPYSYTYQGFPHNYYITSVVVPILLESSFIGAIGVDIDLVNLQKKLRAITLYNKGYVSLISPKAEIIAHRDSSYIKKNFFEIISPNDTITPYVIRNGVEYSYESISEFSGEEVFRTFYPIRIGNSDKRWSIMVEISKMDAAYRSSQLHRVALAVLILGLLLIAYLIYNIFDRIKYEKELIIAKEIAEKSEKNLQKMYYELQTSEEELRATNEELWATTEALKENNILLQQAKEKAEESSRLKTAFLQNLSHEVRTPLNAISGFSQLLLKAEGLDEEMKSYTQIIQNSSKQLVSVISDIVTISSIETGQERVNSTNVHLNQVLDEVKEIYSLEVKDKPIELKVSKAFSDGDDEILIDVVKFKQIMSKLLSNAIKFSQHGTVEFGYALKNNYLEFYVKDTGIGIDRSNHSLIFERFTQVDENIHALHGGAGLGLSICKGFVQLLGGNIWVESELGQGATFYFTLPYSPVVNPVHTNGIAKPIQQERCVKILIAEDDINSFKLLKALLKDYNYEIIHAKTGTRAVEICQQDKSIGLVLMDIKMPEMDGVTATLRIREHNPAVTVIAQTAYATLDDIEKYKHVFDDYVTKPVNVENLKRIISKFCDKQKGVDVF